MRAIFSKNGIYYLLLPVSLGFMLFTLLSPYTAAEKIAPGTSLYGFPLKYLNDFSLYVYDIKLGQEGKILWKNPFSEEYYPEFILQPHYPIMGMLSRPFALTPYETYAIARIAAYVFLAIFVYVIVYFTFSNQWNKILAFVLFMTSTSIWQIVEHQGLQRIQEPVTYSNWFNIFLRHTMLPPHHLIAVLLLFIILLRIVFLKNTTVIHSIVTAGISFCLAFIHPYIANYALFIIAVYSILDIIIRKKIPKQLLFHAFLVALFAFPVVVYHGWTLTAIFKDPVYLKGTLEHTKPFLPFFDYIKALGMIIFIPSIGIFISKNWINPLTRMFMIWAYLPIILFYLPSIIPIPTSNLRIFQMYQIIPLSFLTAKTIEYVSIKIKIPLWFLPLILSMLSIMYAIPAYSLEYQYHTSSMQPYFSYIHVMQQIKPIYPLLNNLTKPQSIVMAPELVSLLIPGNTHNFVILGHNNRDLERKKAEIEYFFEGNIPLNMLEEFIKKYRTSYIIFGLHSKPLRQLPYYNNPLFEIMYDNNGVTVVKVLYSSSQNNL